MSARSSTSGVFGFLRQIEQTVPAKLDVHTVVDNYATHKHPGVQRWLAARPRFHVHLTPTYAFWLNQAKVWFHRITQQAIRRGTFRSAQEWSVLVERESGCFQKYGHAPISLSTIWINSRRAVSSVLV